MIKESIKGINIPIVPFVFGAVAGGAFTFLLGSILKKNWYVNIIKFYKGRESCLFSSY